jgi:hypothetical protein
MTTTITWAITALDCSTTETNPDTVITAHWTCSGVNGEYSTSVYSTCSLPPPEGTFVPYDQLTQEQVLGWCWANGVDKNETEAGIQANIDNQINPPVVTPPLPWVTPETGAA